MSKSSSVSNWASQFNDPFAVLGIAVTAEDRRVQKRYREVAKRLHPDRFIEADAETQETTTKLFARLVNPAYEKLQQEKERKENISLLRLNVRKLTREGPLAPKSEIARQLLERPVSNVDVFYEQAIAQLAETQYAPYDNFPSVTEQLQELNLVYLQLKMGDLGGVQEKRTGIVAANVAKPIQVTPTPIKPEVVAESYDQRHYRRAQEYAKKGAWSQVVQELRDAVKIKADKSEYHSLLGVAYLHIEKPLKGMAKVHLKRALELNPEDKYAVRFAAKVGLTVSSPPPSPPKTNGKHVSNGASANPQPVKRGGLFGIFGRR